MQIKRAQLFICVLLFWTKGSLEKISGSKQYKKALSDEKTARSALIGIKPEDILTIRNADASGSRKSDVNFLQQLPAIQDEQRLTNSALVYSGQLSPIDQHVVTQFDKEVEGNHDDSSHGITSKIDGADPFDPSRQNSGSNNVSRESRNFVEKVTRDEMGKTEDMSTLRNGGMDKDFYSQISQIEQDQPQAANVGKLSDMYKDNPLPEYSYKESGFDKDSSDYHASYLSNPFEMPKNQESGYDKVSSYDHPNYGSNPFEIPKNNYQGLDTLDKELFQGGNNYQEEPHHLSSEKTDLFSSIGKKVVLDLLKHQNDSEHVSEDNLKQEFLNKLMEGNLENKNMGINSLLTDRMKTTISPFQTQETTTMATKPYAINRQFPTLPSQGKVLTSGKISSKDILGFGTEQVAQPANPRIQGHVFQGDPLTPSLMFKTQSPTVQESPGADRPLLNNLIHSKEEGAGKDNYVTLKISGAGKPVSFKAGTSNDGSLVLKIPGNVTLMNTDTNKVVSEASQNTKENSNSKPQMVTDVEQMNRYLWASQTAPTQEFAKKGNMIEGHGENLNNEMLSWQILGKTNTKLNQENDVDHSEANQILQNAHKVLSPTKGRNFKDLQRSPNISPTKYNELNPVSFAGVGQSPPSEIFPPSLRLRGSVEKNKLLSLKSFLRPSKFIEDSPENRARLSFGPVHDQVRTSTDGSNEKRNSWSPCSVTCGQGIQARAQLCEGTQCRGYRTESKACFMQPCPEQLGRAGLRLHNKFRMWHKSPPLKWSQRLAAKAQTIAKKLADNSIRLSDLKEEHSGINVARLWHSFDIAAEKATADWYSEVKSYNFDDPIIDSSTKHFTQLIWKSSKRLGIGEAKTTDGKHTFVVALYDPPGNTRDEQITNVHLPKPQSEK
ncbi:hypothetical protein ACROYT_G005413 [Oculina patagonica]